jgi:hypothetical protein
MARKRAPFTQAYIERALRAADRQGWGSIVFSNPGGGMMRIDKGAPEMPTVPATPFDEWKAKRDARAA